MGRPKGSRNKAKAAPIAATEAIRRPSADDVRRAVIGVNRQKASAAEYTGLAGQATKQFCDRWNISKEAFRFARKLASMEDIERQPILIDLADLCRLMGFTDQESLFEDTGAALDSLKGNAEAGPTEEEIAERTASELAEAPDFVTTTHAERTASDRLNGEIDAALSGRPN